MKFILFVVCLSAWTHTDASERKELQAEPPTNWGKHFNINVPTDCEPGNQVLHSKSTNKPYRNDVNAVEFVKTHLSAAQRLDSDADVLRFGIDSVALEKGFFLEMGVGMCRTINFIAGLKPKTIIHGFDSFQGLSEDWDKGTKVIKQGTFALKDPENYMPVYLNNVRVYKGLFSDVLPQFKAQYLKETPIALLHIDCDSYTPTKDVFNALGKNIVAGTVIVFDELYNYPTYAEHEYKAFQEFIMISGLSYEYLAYNVNHEQVAVRIK